VTVGTWPVQLAATLKSPLTGLPQPGGVLRAAGETAARLPPNATEASSAYRSLK